MLAIVTAPLVTALLAAAPLTLDEALAEAQRGNPDLAAARADALVAGADVTASVGGYLPRLDLQASFGRNWIGPQDARTVIQGGSPIVIPEIAAYDQSTYAGQLQLVQPLFEGLRTLRQVDAARAQERAAARQLDETGLAVAFAVTQAFYDAVRADRSLAVLEKTAARSQDLVGRADALYAAGRAPKSDTFQARVNLGNDRISIEGQRARVAQARTALAVLLGRPADAPLELVPPPGVDGAAQPSDLPPLEDLVALARARRPSVAASTARVEAARAQIGAAQADYWPSLAATGVYARQNDSLSGTSGLLGDPTRNYTVVGQIVLSWNLFDGRRTVAAVRRAEAGASRAAADATKAQDQVVREVADARAAASALARQRAIAEENLVAATQGLALARERLDAGLATQLELRDASLKLTQAELAVVQARIDHAVALADLARATGGAPR